MSTINDKTPKSSPSSTSTAKLRPDAPPYVPLAAKNLFFAIPKEPQCSRYSRKSVRRDILLPNSPRPILGTKIPFPRPILGRKDNITTTGDQENKENEYPGKEFKCTYRKMQKLKIGEEQVEKQQGKHRLKQQQSNNITA